MSLSEINTAAEQVKHLLYEPTDNDKLKLYGLYKQSTQGDVTGNRPSGFFNIKEKAKYDAWNENKGLSKENAMKLYVDFVSELQNK